MHVQYVHIPPKPKIFIFSGLTERGLNEWMLGSKLVDTGVGKDGHGGLKRWTLESDPVNGWVLATQLQQMDAWI